MSQAPLLVHQLMDHQRFRNDDDYEEEREKLPQSRLLVHVLEDYPGTRCLFNLFNPAHNKDDKHRLENIIQDKILHCHPACALYYPRFDACI